MMRTILGMGLAGLLLAATPSARAQETPQPNLPLTRARAIAGALEAHPRLESLAWDRRAALAAAEQAGRGLYPELELEVENFAGSGGWSGFDGAEITLLLSHTFELGGKRGRAREAAAWEVETVAGKIGLAAAEIAFAVDGDFDRVLAAENGVALAEELVALASDSLEQIRRRSARGAASAADVARARTALAAAELDLSQARHDLRTARAQLATWWPRESGFPAALSGSLEPVPDLPDWERLVAAVPNSPALKRWETAVGQSRAEAALAAAFGRVDLRAAAGVRHDRLSGDNAAVAAVSIPLAVRGRNADGVRAAAARLDGLAADGRSRQAALVRDLAAVHGRLAAARDRVLGLKTTILPLAAETLAATEEAYRKGRHSLTDVLAVRRDWAAERARYTAALLACRTARREIDLMLGWGAPVAPTAEEN